MKCLYLAYAFTPLKPQVTTNGQLRRKYANQNAYKQLCKQDKNRPGLEKMDGAADCDLVLLEVMGFHDNDSIHKYNRNNCSKRAIHRRLYDERPSYKSLFGTDKLHHLYLVLAVKNRHTNSVEDDHDRNHHEHCGRYEARCF